MIIALAILGLPVLIDVVGGTVSTRSNVSFDSTRLSSTTGNVTEDEVDSALKTAVKGSDTKSTPPP